MGRTAKRFDLKQVEQLGAIQCTYEEVAAVLGCSADTIARRMKRSKTFKEALERGQQTGKASLRRLQWEAAKKGNVTMLIWLGKNLLGQTDVPQGNTDVGGMTKLTPDQEAKLMDALTVAHGN